MSFSQKPRTLNTTRQDLVQNHVESFNFLFKTKESPGCLDMIIKHLPIYEIDSPYITDKPIWRYYIKSIQVEKPYKTDSSALDKRLFPAECRQRRLTYSAPLLATLVWEYIGDNGIKTEEFLLNFGAMPIMLRSNKCHLSGLSSKQLIKVCEDLNELGGYFIANGNERVIRMIVSERRNQLFCVQRPTFKQRHDKYTDLGLLIRCIREDEAINQNVLHYVEDGSVTIEFRIGSAIYLMPVILLLRALQPTTDREIYNKIMQGIDKEEKNLFLSERIELMLQQSKQLTCRSQKECLAFIGEKFRRFYGHLSMHTSAESIGEELLKNCIFIHCGENIEKFNLLTLAIRKLYAFVEGKLCAHKIDVATDCHEIVTSGHVIAGIIRNGLLQYLQSIKDNCLRYFRKHSSNTDSIQYESATVFEPLINPQKIVNGQIADRLCYFVNTGNLPYADRNWKQKAGWAITADRINYFRFLSHFRAVHRGQFWTEMRTTVVRKLRPECWGFLCPVHTPDGKPCGLLNHLAEPASIVTHYYLNQLSREDLVHTLLSIGLFPLDSLTGEISHAIPVILDGIFIGYVSSEIAADFVINLRKFKIKQKHSIPQTLSIAAVYDYSQKIWPEITLSTLPARLIRPVTNLKYNKIEWITPMEQTFLNIAVIKAEIKANVTTHLEVSAQSTLSVLAGCTPFSDHNQSPRNMYQCQMLKQAMGLFAMNLDYRTDNKAYRLQYPQTPITQNDVYKKYDLDDYACGTNAVVAVISYTGYDMEDAMIICKESMERGFKHGYVYMTKVIDLTSHQTQLGELHLHLSNVCESNQSIHNRAFDRFGLPLIGSVIAQNQALYVLYNDIKREFTEIMYRKAEQCIVSQVRIIKYRNSESGNSSEPVIVSLKLRYNRSPIIGDKFASRAGQKGTLAQLWPQSNMPFCGNGIVPDLIINPHAFPSRMTIGMLLESMANKCGALNGAFYDSTPFKTEQNNNLDLFGQKLLQNGYNYYGSEAMLCGTNGRAMKADIFIGLVYYQRLRHMISDKYQVRALGPVNNLTKQPLKGRKRRGGIRLGEMERDSIVSHGCAYLLHDRLFHNSDGECKWICGKCHSFLSVSDLPSLQRKWCRVCESKQHLTRVNVPHVFSYLAHELAAMNVKLSLMVQGTSLQKQNNTNRIALP